MPSRVPGALWWGSCERLQTAGTRDWPLSEPITIRPGELCLPDGGGIRVSAAFAMGRFAVTFEAFDHCCTVTGRSQIRRRLGRGSMPVHYVSFDEATAYNNQFARTAGRRRLLISDKRQ
jgi:hypothetical protein